MKGRDGRELCAFTLATNKKRKWTLFGNEKISVCLVHRYMILINYSSKRADR